MQNNVAIDQKLHMFLSCLPQNEVEEITSPHKDISESLLLFNSFKANWPASVTDIDCVFFDRIDRNVTYIARVDRKKAVCKEGVLTLVHIFLPCSDHAYLARIAKTNDNDKQRRDDALASETAASLKTAIKDFVVQHNMVSADAAQSLTLKYNGTRLLQADLIEKDTIVSIFFSCAQKQIGIDSGMVRPTDL